MRSSIKRLLVFISISVLLVGSVGSQPSKNDRGQQKHEKSNKVHHFVKKGPPPWAPAHGYRGHDNYRDYGLMAVPIDLPTSSCNREVMGQILGGTVGGVVGSQIGDGNGRLIAVAAGTLIGMVIGGEIGRSMDRADQLCFDQALEHAPDGSPIHWNDDGRQYTVTPRETFQNTEGRYCREYSMEAEIQGQARQVYGKACRQPDGSWQIVKA